MTRHLGAIRGDEPAKRTRVFTGADLMYPDEIKAWAAWLRRLGIDPGRVANPGMVVADDDARTISWLDAARDDQGRVVLRKNWDGTPSVDHKLHTLQLEAPAPAFPDDAPDWPYG